jgi:GrpB-like predicted nucleotidyltransferase (UPF0157 family)
MLGLEYGTVALAPHDPGWTAAFRRERERLAAVLAAPDCRIEHIGSTAVPGLDAKPILDIAVGVDRSVAVEPLIVAIEGLDYRYRGDAGADGGHVFVRESVPRVRTHHLHLVRLDDPQWSAYLSFRDLLRRDAAARADYAAAKRELAARFPANRTAYTEAKDEIVGRLLAEARSGVGG